MGLCSKCYREAQGAEQKKSQETSIPGATQKIELAAPAAVVEEAAQVPEAEVVDVASAAVPEPESPPSPQKPVQANRSRCFSCNKKVGLLGFECRCGYMYCSGHRHAADHSCLFDYASFERERFAKANPVVAASKIDKL